jgi:nicotinamide mononucleotide adenylyltransferase
MLEAVDDFTVGYGGEEENRDHRHPFTRGHGREGLQRMLGADVGGLESRPRHRAAKSMNRDRTGR